MQKDILNNTFQLLILFPYKIYSNILQDMDNT